jgi:hypothetical protein
LILKKKQGNSYLGREMYNIPDMINISASIYPLPPLNGLKRKTPLKCSYKSSFIYSLAILNFKNLNIENKEF